MAADLIFFCKHINWSWWPRFKVNIILNFLHDNEVIRANLHVYAYKRILNRRPFMNKVYTQEFRSYSFDYMLNQRSVNWSFRRWIFILLNHD